MSQARAGLRKTLLQFAFEQGEHLCGTAARLTNETMQVAENNRTYIRSTYQEEMDA